MKKTFFLFIFFGLLFWIKNLFLIDPDLGWQLRTGQYILSKGIPYTDQFSYTMPSYPWIAHEWLSGVLFSLVFSAGGMILLSVILIALFFILLFVLLGKNKFSDRHFMPLLLFFTVIISFWDLRPQVFSWCFFSLLLYTTFDPKRWIRYRWIWPILFVLWVNLHGGFALGIFTLFAFLVFRTYKKLLSFSDCAVFILSCLATLCNPYGVRIYYEVFNTVTNPALHTHIAEWNSIFVIIDLSTLLFVPIAVVLVWKYKFLFTVYQLFLFFFLCIFSATSIKQIPLWAIVSLPLIMQSIDQLFTDSKKKKEMIQRLNQSQRFASGLIIVFFAANIYLQIVNFQILKVFHYPDQAIAFLKTHPENGELFSIYNWGGYLDWQYPEKKVFIDGRMAIWHWNAPSPELDAAYTTYRNITGLKTSFEPVFTAFHICQVLYPNDPDPFLDALKAKGWRQVYQDSVAVIYQKGC